MGNLKGDIFGGISVAAMSIPIAIAYAEIAGMPPESGIYTAVIALLAYFLLGSSRQVIIGTDFATVVLFSATVTAAFGPNHASATQFMMMVTVMTGVWMFVAGLLKLGLIANFLSKPVMLGYLNGVSVLLFVSQLDKLTGLSLEQDGLIRRILEVFGKAELINLPTLVLGIGSILFLLLFKNFVAKLPAAILLFTITIIAAYVFDLGSWGIAFMPKIQYPYPRFIFPDLKLFFDHFPQIFLASAAVMFVSYTSAIPVIRGFSKDLKGFDPNREFYALGLAHVGIGFLGGFPVSGDDSRTAVNVAVGGRTKFVNIIAAFFIFLTVLLIPGILTALPLVTIAAIIASAGITMFERGAGIMLYRADKKEFLVFAVCVLGVLALGVYQGILFAIVLAFFQLIKRSSKPDEFELFFDKETNLLMEHSEYAGPRDDAVLIYRFGSALLFYNVEYFVERITQRIESKSNLKLLILDATSVNMIDLTALLILRDLIKKLNTEGVEVVFAGANKSFKSSVLSEISGHDINTDIFYPNIISVFDREVNS